MPRKSKYLETHSSAESWTAGLYIRLSREDGDKEESDSIQNQKSFLTDFVSHHPDISTGEIYSDDGFSGTNFERPDFHRMIADIRDKKINCVIVKDLSRLGRNYREVGRYTEDFFPFMNVRFISLNDNLDSFLRPQEMENAMVPIRNIMNDEYCRDISKKVRSSLTIKRRQGKFIGSFASYGYNKDPDDHNRLLVDSEAAHIVMDIYRWFLDGNSIIGIAKRLNSLGIPNPSTYKRRKGLNYRHPQQDINDGAWPDSSVRRILSNRIYTGSMVQGKTQNRSYKFQKAVNVAPENWIIVPRTHQAIISEETFEKVQLLLSKDMRTAPGNQKVYLFAGFLKCADCGRAMNRKTLSQPNREYCYYICSTYKKMNQASCSKHTIRTDRLEKAVLVSIQKQTELVVEMEALISEINERRQNAIQSSGLPGFLSSQKKELERFMSMKLSLYPDWKSGDISKDEYIQLKGRFDQQLAELKQSIQKAEDKLKCEVNDAGASNPFFEVFKKQRSFDHLTREMLLELVDVIYVHEGGGITIRFKFADEFKKATEYIEENKNLVRPA